MSVSIVLRLGQGNFEQAGFPVSLQVLEHRNTGQSIDHGSKILDQSIDYVRIPAAPQIPSSYASFQEQYKKLGVTRALKAVQDQTTHASYQEELDACREEIRKLEDTIEQWFKHSSFEMLQGRIMTKTAQVPHDQAIPIIINADTGIEEQNTQLQKLPWHLWSLFIELRNAEPVLAANIDTQVNPLTSPINILAIFGSSEGGLQLSEDERILSQLEQLGAKIKLSYQPTREQLHTRREQLHNLLWHNSWDILFFAGHSASQSKCTEGFIQISDQQKIPLKSLREDLMRAVQRGLKLAIFNSCDGLGIASELINLKVPSLVVMREPVPDVVARKFLRYFFEDFSQGRSLYRAVQTARKRLQAQEHDDLIPCPAASWLPIVCQNPNHPELVWLAPRIVRRISWRNTALLGAGLLLLLAAYPKIFPPKPKLSSLPPPAITVKTDSPRFSLGETLLFQNNVTADKQRGIQAFAQGKYQDAIDAFNASLKKIPNDPEASIYKNDAIANLPGTQRLRIGVSIPISSNPDVAAEMLRGIAQAQDQINKDAKGINGAKLEIKLADDHNDPTLAPQVATEFVNDDKVLAVIGHNASNASAAAAPIYNQKNLVLITPTSYAWVVTDYGPYIFQSTPSAQEFAKPLASYIAKTAHIRKIAVCHDSEALDNETFLKEVQFLLQQMGSEIVKTTLCDIDSAQFNADNALDEARNQGAQALILAPYIDRIDRATSLAVANANKNDPFPLFGSPSFYTIETLKAGAAVNGLVFPTAWHPDIYPNTPFLKAATSLWGTPSVNWRTATSYDATVAAIAALRQSQFRSGIQRALMNPNFAVEGAEGADSKVRFDRDRTRNLPIHLIQVKSTNPSKSRTGFDFVLLK